MSTSSKSRLCWNCDGSVPAALDHCTYCGVNLKGAPKPQPKPPQDALKPPYSLNQAVSEAPQPPFALNKGGDSQAEAAQDNGGEESAAGNSAFKPLVALLVGSVFFLFGLVLWLFSDHGTFTLQWNASYWFVYFFVGLIALALGWTSLKTVEDPL